MKVSFTHFLCKSDSNICLKSLNQQGMCVCSKYRTIFFGGLRLCVAASIHNIPKKAGRQAMLKTSQDRPGYSLTTLTAQWLTIALKNLIFFVFSSETIRI